MQEKKNHHYNPKMKDFARKLRTESISKAEKFIWKAALSKKQLGYGFKRQRPIGKYIVDFFCAELNLIIEVDGNSHFFKAEEDSSRQIKLEELGYTIVRFDEGEVLNQFDYVYKSLCHIVMSLKDQKDNIE